MAAEGRVIYYERHLGDFAKDTTLLSQGQVGAYDLLLDYYYSTERPLPLDKNDLYNITRARTPAERANTDRVIAQFFMKTDQGYTKGRVEAEIERYRTKSEKAAASAKARWSQSKGISERNANASANAMRTHCGGNAIHTPYIPLPNGNGQAPPAASPSAEQIIWSDGLRFLTERGVKEGSARAFLGGLVKSHGAAETLRGIEAAIDADAGEPKSYIVAVLGRQGSARRAAV
jgi:uncharacterized protein YdaU (DUF1376 family)